MLFSEIDFLDALNIIVSGHSYTPVIHESEEALVVEFIKGQKKVVLIWSRGPAEVQLNFYLDGERVYDDRVECAEEPEKNNFIAQLRRIVDRFLNYEVKMFEEGTLLKVKDLKYHDDNGWQHVV